MICEDVRESLALYLDGGLDDSQLASCDRHLDVCPVCRATRDELRRMARELSMISRPLAPADLAVSISSRIGVGGIGVSQNRPAGPLLGRLRPFVMPYTIGALASLILFFTILTALRPHLKALRDWEAASRLEMQEASARIASESATEPEYDLTLPIPSDIYAAQRAPFAVESPSLNPNGALAALTSSDTHSHRGRGADDMVILTDVFSNGQASIAEIVHAPRHRQMLDDFQRALHEDAPFVPASYDRRPETMRVVFVFQKVNVRDRDF